MSFVVLTEYWLRNSLKYHARALSKHQEDKFDAMFTIGAALVGLDSSFLTVWRKVLLWEVAITCIAEVS